jgi:hypothetical protein
MGYSSDPVGKVLLNVAFYWSMLDGGPKELSPFGWIKIFMHNQVIYNIDKYQNYEGTANSNYNLTFGIDALEIKNNLIKECKNHDEKKQISDCVA